MNLYNNKAVHQIKFSTIFPYPVHRIQYSIYSFYIPALPKRGVHNNINRTGIGDLAFTFSIKYIHTLIP